MLLAWVQYSPCLPTINSAVDDFGVQGAHVQTVELLLSYWLSRRSGEVASWQFALD